MKRSTQGLLLALGSVLMLGSCASVQPPQPPSLELPSPPADLRSVRKADRVTLTWTVPTQTTDRQRVRTLGATRVCRGLEPVLQQCGTPVGEVAAAAVSNRSATQKNQATYVDTLPEQVERKHPLEFATYAVEVLNANGRSAGLSKQVRVPLAPTLAAPPNFEARLTAQGVVLTWARETAAPNAQLRLVYHIYRRQEGGEQETQIAELPLENSSNTFTDSSIEWEQTYYYRADVVTVVRAEGQSEARVEGEDTPEIKVFAHDVFPPAVPSALQAVFSGPGQPPAIDLIWAPVADADLAGYNVYRHEGGGGPVKINAELVKTPAYRDADVRGGKTYFYSVSAVDVRGNESGRSEEASESVP